MKTKKKAKAKHKPDWPLVFADKIEDHEKRIAALEHGQTNPIPPLTVPVPKPGITGG
jgi:hypothetical protein